MPRNRVAALAALMVLASATRADAADASTDEGALLMLAPAIEHPAGRGKTAAGTVVGVEAPVLDGRLEFEASLAALQVSGHTEISGDGIVKVPFRLTTEAELAIGIGPTWARALGGPERALGMARGTEIGFEYTRWTPAGFAWFVEPGWSRQRSGSERSLGLAAGVLLPLR